MARDTEKDREHFAAEVASLFGAPKKYGEYMLGWYTSRLRQDALLLGTGSTTSALADEVFVSVYEALAAKGPRVAPIRKGREGALPAKEEAVEAVSKAVWILWQDDLERIWQLVCEWAGDGKILDEAAVAILEQGMSESHITDKEAFDKIEQLLLSDEEGDQNTGGVLIQAVPEDLLIEATDQWTQSEDELRIRRLPKLMRQLLEMRLPETLKVFHKWLRADVRKFSPVLAESVQGYLVPETEPEAFYRGLARQLDGIKYHATGAGRRAAGRLQKDVKDHLSRMKNKAIRSKRTPRAASLRSAPKASKRYHRRKK